MSDKIDDGGYAFPRSIVHVLTDGQVMGYEAEGMSLRDYFAVAALQGYMSAEDNELSMFTGETVEQAVQRRLKERAEFAYKQADAMLRARRPA